MDDLKIKKINIEHFRGITNDLSLSFDIKGKAESALIFGDNGSGKSSIIDAIEFITQGSIQGNQSGAAGGFIYNSVSLENKETAKLVMELSDAQQYLASFVRNDDEVRVDRRKRIISQFRYAPFIIRRMDILNFWGEQVQRKLMLFFRYVKTDTENMPVTEDEKVTLIEQRRLDKKNERRVLIETICNYYKINPSEIMGKNKGDFFAYIKPFNKGRNLKQLSERHPQYENLTRLNKLYDEIAKINKEYREAVKGLNPESNEDRNAKHREKLQKIMLEISPDVTRYFKKISRATDFVKEIEIHVANQSDMSLDFTVVLENGEIVSPLMLFSEANRDLLALLIYFEYIHYSRNFGQANVLVLDDIFQSVDSTIRYRVMQYLIDRFSDWQIIITTHDRLWKEQLIQLFRNHGKALLQYEITHWSFREGPRIVGSTNSFDEKLLHSVDAGSTADICASAGYLLEYMCEKLSCILSTSIKRRFGDRYTIGDLWPGIYKELKKSQGKEVFSELNDLLYLRNMVGSHYNEWSLSLSRAEANDFAKAVLDAYYLVCCKHCGKWIKNVSDITGESFTVTCCGKQKGV